MRIHFLTGPSGTGKTHRCIREVRERLVADPAGPPLLFLAPKQATFQIERALLEDGQLQGYTRLQILSFERLATFILAQLRPGVSRIIGQEGRLMLLRHILSNETGNLRVFRPSSQLPGFALELSKVMDELEQSGATPKQVQELAAKVENDPELSARLRDLAHLIQAYFARLEELGLHDAGGLLRLAAEAIEKEPELHFEGIWVDGFAELSRRELTLLCVLLRRAQYGLLAFNYDGQFSTTASWLSPWHSSSKFLKKLQTRLAEFAEIQSVPLSRSTEGRFAGNPVLAHLERHWDSPQPCQGSGEEIGRTLRLMECPDMQAEATQAAREILEFTRNGGRFREIAIVARDLEPYHEVIASALSRYGIPFFMDRRVPAAHHPLCELTRSALRLVAFDWQNEDWFVALKTGLLPAKPLDLDHLENEALARGIHGAMWRSPLLDRADKGKEHAMEKARLNVARPFLTLEAELGQNPSGGELVEALRRFWEALGIERSLQQWSDDSKETAHLTLFEQLQRALDDIALAFGESRAPLRQWVEILETLLAAQTVGVIPPALDQVLVGAVDRSRNPSLKLTLVLGLNEGIFPAAAPTPGLLTPADREKLASHGLEIPLRGRNRWGEEMYLGYIAFTRSSGAVAGLWSRFDRRDKPLNRSSLVEHILKLFPGAKIEEFQAGMIVHPSDLFGQFIASGGEGQGWRDLFRLPEFDLVRTRLPSFGAVKGAMNLTAELAEALYGNPLKTSTSQLEEFAKCQFRFFIRSGLRARERKLFELDAREQGTFQHEILRRLHETSRAQGKAWIKLPPSEAATLVERICAEISTEYQDGLLAASARSRFQSERMKNSLIELVRALCGWGQQYRFEPARAEIGFGTGENLLPAWSMTLEGGKELAFSGKIDRIDLFRDPASNQAWCVVIDYKSSPKKLKVEFVQNGVQLQLLAYLGALASLRDPKGVFEVERIVPAGAFYVSLRGNRPGSVSRVDALHPEADHARIRFQHYGRFDSSLVEFLDSRSGVEEGDQFRYRRKKNGDGLDSRGDAMPRPEFERLLDTARQEIQRLGKEVFLGQIEPNPCRLESGTVCDLCEFHPICRIDKFAQSYRKLKRRGA